MGGDLPLAVITGRIPQRCINLEVTDTESASLSNADTCCPESTHFASDSIVISLVAPTPGARPLNAEIKAFGFVTL